MKKSGVLDFFEIKRPAKSSLKNSCSVSHLDKIINEDEIKPKERLFIKHSGTLPKTTRYKKKVSSISAKMNNVEADEENIDSNTSVRLLTKKFENIIETQQVHREYRRSQSFIQTSQFMNTNGETDSTETKTNTEQDHQTITNEDNIKNEMIEKSRRQSETRYYSNTSTINKKEHRKNIRSFGEAETEEEKELYRKKLLEEMDEQFAKMRMDGFLNYTENVHENQISHEESTFKFSENTSICTEENEITLQKHKEEHSYYVSNESYGMFTEDFSESLGDDLENGSFVVEAYNDDGRELIIVQLSIEKKVVNLNSLQSIKEVMEESDMVFFEGENHTLSTVSDPEEIIIKSCSSVPEEPIYEEVPMYIPSTSKRYSAPPHVRNDESEYSEVFYDQPPVQTRSNTCSVVSSQSSRNEEDEGISTSYENVYGSVRRETFCDNQGNIRIERIGYPEKSEESSDEAASSPVSRNNSINSTKRLTYVIEEIQLTESKYVHDLEKIVKSYIPYIENHTPPQLVHLHADLFGNISKIYKKQKKFLKAILNCGDDVDDIANVFLEHETLFDLYPLYFKNKPKSDMILKEFQPIIKQMQDKYGERLDFSAYLLTPVQRLGRYILFMENIEKELKKVDGACENIQKALKIVKSVMSRGNDCVAIESIQRSPISKIDFGSFIMREKFTLTKPRRLEIMVFLFSNLVVFTVEDPKNIELFTYYDSIRMDDLRIATFEDGTIHLIDFTKTKRHRFNSQRYTFVMETKADKVRNTWRETIEQMLWQQLAKEKANSLKVDPKVTKKKQTAKRRPKSTGASIFYAI